MGFTGLVLLPKIYRKTLTRKETAVQVGDPFLEKLLMEATLECIQKKAPDLNTRYGSRRLVELSQ